MDVLVKSRKTGQIQRLREMQFPIVVAGFSLRNFNRLIMRDL
jgi:hypothetical protein